jgi:hypothetical protein
LIEGVALAQAAANTVSIPLDPITKELLGFGVLGVACLVEGFVIWVLWKAYHNAQDKLTELMKTMLPVIEASNRITAAHTLGLDTRNRITEGLVSTIEKNTNEIENQGRWWGDRWGRIERLLETLSRQERQG